MIGAVIITHGDLGSSLLRAASKILSMELSIPFISIEWKNGGKGIEEKVSEVKDAVSQENKGDGVIVFTDIFGGTPTNLCISMLEDENVEIITGVNLPLLLKFFLEREKMSLGKLSSSLIKRGKESIGRIREILEK